MAQSKKTLSQMKSDLGSILGTSGIAVRLSPEQAVTLTTLNMAAGIYGSLNNPGPMTYGGQETSDTITVNGASWIETTTTKYPDGQGGYLYTTTTTTAVTATAGGGIQTTWVTTSTNGEEVRGATVKDIQGNTSTSYTSVSPDGAHYSSTSTTSASGDRTTQWSRIDPDGSTTEGTEGRKADGRYTGETTTTDAEGNVIMRSSSVGDGHGNMSTSISETDRQGNVTITTTSTDSSGQTTTQTTTVDPEGQEIPTPTQDGTQLPPGDDLQPWPDPEVGPSPLVAGLWEQAQVLGQQQQWNLQEQSAWMAEQLSEAILTPIAQGATGEAIIDTQTPPGHADTLLLIPQVEKREWGDLRQPQTRAALTASLQTATRLLQSMDALLENIESN